MELTFLPVMSEDLDKISQEPERRHQLQWGRTICGDRLLSCALHGNRPVLVKTTVSGLANISMA